MDLGSKAKAVAELDAICDAYEQAYRCGELAGDDSRSLDTWLDRVSPELRDWLQEELIALRLELQHSAPVRHRARRRTSRRRSWLCRKHHRVRRLRRVSIQTSGTR